MSLFIKRLYFIHLNFPLPKSIQEHKNFNKIYDFRDKRKQFRHNF